LSTNTVLVPQGNITLGGTGNVRTIIIQPAPNIGGNTTIAVTVTDANGGSATDSFALRIGGSRVAPLITSQPVDQTVAAGGSATFLVMAGGSHPMAYQWQRNGAILPGATSAALNIVNAAPGNVGDYRVTISNAAGSVTSAVARLTVVLTARIDTITWLPGSVRLSFQTINGANYTVEHSSSLTSWTPLQSVAGNGGSVTVTDFSPAAGSRFYRLRVQ
jgi:beta-galactosidase